MSAAYDQPPRSGGACWKWGGIACAGCGCILVILAAIGVVIVLNRPEMRRMLRTTREASQAVVRMQQVGKAIGKYVQDHGDYPEKLTDLAPTYVALEKLRPSDDPTTLAFEYHKPPANAPADFVMLVYEVRYPVPHAPTPTIRYYLTKAGQLGTTTSMPTDTASPGSAGPPSGEKAPTSKR